MPRTPRLLVLDAYPREGRAELRGVGASEAGALYAALLGRLLPGAGVEVGHPADADWALAAGVALADYDGLVWTGSSLTIHHADDPRVQRQVALARQAYAEGVPAFGSCWAAQLAVVAAGGACGPNPRGREFGLARKITLSEAGRAHPLFRGRSGAFDAFTSHQDQVVTLPAGARCLAGNAFTRVQAVAVQHGRGRFWAVQYHPEYDLHEVARLAALRAPALVAQGSLRDAAAAADWIARLEALHADPARTDLAFELGIDADVLDPAQRVQEVRAWLDLQVLPRAAR